MGLAGVTGASIDILVDRVIEVTMSVDVPFNDSINLAPTLTLESDIHELNSEIKEKVLLQSYSKTC